MSILSGWIKERCYKKTTDGYRKVSRDVSSETVYMSSGITLDEALCGDGKQIKILTEAEYNALSTAEKNDTSILYFYY